jgi:hypothetical protein
VSVAGERFRPPFCPNPRCDFHGNPRGWRPWRWGHYTRRQLPWRVDRYRCPHCRRCFSSQTFAPTYWLRRAALLRDVYEGLVGCTALRQLARRHGVSPSTVQRHSERLGRHSLLFLHHYRPRRPPREPVVLDGFESFAWSQYFPLHVNVAVGAESHFLYAFTEAELRRKGRMTAFQRQRRAELEARFGRADPQAIEKAVSALVRLLAHPGQALAIRSDEHPAYPRAFRRVPIVRIQHQRTSSRAARTTGNPLFPVNRLDLLARHANANHKRETIAYSKRRGAVAERFAIFGVWLNFQKSCSEKTRAPTPAQRLGLVDHPLRTEEILAERRFATRLHLAPAWQRIYDRRVPTRTLPAQRPHTLRYAY